MGERESKKTVGVVSVPYDVRGDGAAAVMSVSKLYGEVAVGQLVGFADISMGPRPGHSQLDARDLVMLCRHLALVIGRYWRLGRWRRRRGAEAAL